MRDVQGEGGLSRSEQLVRYFYNAFPLGLAYCQTKPQLALMHRQPWMALMQRQQVDLPRQSALAHVSAANTLTLLIKASATYTVYRGHRRTLFFLPWIISLFTMCIGIIRNNYLVGGRARAEVWTPATERVTLLHMAPKCSDHRATWANKFSYHLVNIFFHLERTPETGNLYFIIAVGFYDWK